MTKVKSYRGCSPGNTDDRSPLKDGRFTDKLFGKIYADKGYISQSLFVQLFVDDIHLGYKTQEEYEKFS